MSGAVQKMNDYDNEIEWLDNELFRYRSIIPILFFVFMIIITIAIVDFDRHFNLAFGVVFFDILVLFYLIYLSSLDPNRIGVSKIGVYVVNRKTEEHIPWEKTAYIEKMGKLNPGEYRCIYWANEKRMKAFPLSKIVYDKIMEMPGMKEKIK